MARSRSATAKSKQLSEWTFHIALLVKQQIIPELKKGLVITDKRFLQVLRQIDEQFETAYAVAVNILTPYRAKTNLIRVPSTTRSLLENLRAHLALRARSLTPPEAGMAAPSPTPARAGLPDGNYVGVLKTGTGKDGAIEIKYGPFTVTANGRYLSERARVGDRIAFRIVGGDALVEKQEP